MLPGQSGQMDLHMGGHLCYATTKSLLDGKNAPATLLDWKSWKLKRKGP